MMLLLNFIILNCSAVRLQEMAIDLHGVREVIYMNMASPKVIAANHLVETE